MSPIQTDAKGDYIQIDYTPTKYQTALAKIFNRGETTSVETVEPGTT
jgi:hypothetical protein